MTAPQRNDGNDRQADKRRNIRRTAWILAGFAAGVYVVYILYLVILTSG
jgi:type IV secretory pathway component VirB8